jgi:hypothetical protein
MTHAFSSPHPASSIFQRTSVGKWEGAALAAEGVKNKTGRWLPSARKFTWDYLFCK